MMNDDQIKAYVDDVAKPIWSLLLLIAWRLSNMSEPNPAGHLAAVVDDDNPDPIPGTAGAAFTVPPGQWYAVWEVSTGVHKPTDGTELAANSFSGVVGPGVYMLASPLDVRPPSSKLSPLSTGIIGEVYASKTGALVPTLAAACDLYTVAPLTSWSIKVGKSLIERLTVEDVLVEQRTQ